MTQTITGDKVRPFFSDLNPIWKTHLYPLIATSEIETILKRIIEPRLQELRNGYGLDYFHYDRKVLDDLLAQEKPWLKYPLVVLSRVANPQEYKGPIPEGILLNWQRFVTAMTAAKSPEDIEWWILLHDCGMVNGVFLFHLLKKAFPGSTFTVLTSYLEHVWVQDEKGQNLDLYWPYVGISIREALYDENGVPTTITVSSTESMGC